ncbi:MAG: Tim44/TimA family putative adaptor protein, partial [Rhodoplanes sp.]
MRLRSVLGQRTGRERPPYDPFSARDAVRNAPSEKVVALPPRSSDSVAKPAELSEPADRWNDINLPGSPAADGLQAIVAQDKSFDPQHFLTGSRAAY